MNGQGAKKRLVVIGGGMAGHAIAHAMQDSMDVTLVDPKTYVEVPMAVPRLLVEPHALQARIPYVDFLPKAKIIQGRATAMTDNSVELKTGGGAVHTIDFDFAVIATGSAYSDPLIKAAAPSEAERSAEVASANRLYRGARTVVIVGGGAVGVETAAEFIETLPDVKVILIHGGKSLLENAPGKFGGWAERFLSGHGVELLLNERVTAPPLGQQPIDGVVTTASGKKVEAGAVIWATGVKIETGFVARSFPGATGSDGRLKTDGFLRLRGHPTIFAVGDTTDLPERRMAMIAGLHAKAVTKSLKALALTDDPAHVKLDRYKPSTPSRGLGKMMFVTFGRRRGMSSLPFGQFRAGFLARIKSEDMLVGRVRKGVGLPAQKARYQAESTNNAPAEVNRLL